MAPDPRNLSLRVSDDAQGPTQARTFVLAHIGDRSNALRSDALLLISELVTNAIRHGRPEIVLRLQLQDRTVRFEVHDGSPDAPVLPATAPAPARTGGRGMLIVQAVAARWGVAPAPIGQSGKNVWFELDDVPA